MSAKSGKQHTSASPAPPKTMSEPEEQIQKIIRLKKYEKPREGYFEDFLVEFQRRQRSELLKCSSRSLFVERIGAWLRQIGAAKWVVGFGAAYSIVMVGMMMWSNRSGDGDQVNPNLSPALHEPGKTKPQEKVVIPPEDQRPVPDQDF